MTVNTKKVKGRRNVAYSSYGDLLRDAQLISERTDVKTLGNWSVGQIFQHLAGSIESSIDGTGFKLPWPMRVVFYFLMKHKFLHGKLPAGFKAPSNFQPAPIETTLALEKLRRAVKRLESETHRAMHPAFGNISAEEWDQFNLRHCELHMSFISEES